MECVDDVFWNAMRPFIRKIIEHNWNGMITVPENSIKTIYKHLMDALLQSKNTVFIKLPGVKSPKWPQHIRKKFFRDVDESRDWRQRSPEDDWIFLELAGTTFSGHSTKTTLGNTLRTLTYAWFYQIQAGISETPWDSDRVFTIASGDDCVMFVDPDYADALYDSILEFSCRNTQE